MTNIIVIHQPDFMPHIGFFDKLLKADLWIIYDDVQFLRQGWHHRDKIKTPEGEKWLTLNIHKAPRETNINSIKLSNHTNWNKKHLDMIKNCYSKASAFSEIYPHIEQLYTVQYDKLIDMNMATIKLLLKLFNIHIKYKFSSQFITNKTSNERLVELLKHVRASHYISGCGAKTYFHNKPFEDSHIKVIQHKFNHPCYPQIYGDFISNLSSIDLLFNCGIEHSREILRKST